VRSWTKTGERASRTYKRGSEHRIYARICFCRQGQRRPAQDGVQAPHMCRWSADRGSGDRLRRRGAAPIRRAAHL